MEEDEELIAYINTTFPTYDSLSNIDTVLKSLNQQISTLDTDIHASIKQQAKINVTIKQEMGALQQSTLDTVHKVTSILEKCIILNSGKK